MSERKSLILRSRETGQLFAWTEALAQRADMESVVAVFVNEQVIAPPPVVQEVTIPVVALIGMAGDGAPLAEFPPAELPAKVKSETTQPETTQPDALPVVKVPKAPKPAKQAAHTEETPTQENSELQPNIVLPILPSVPSFPVAAQSSDEDPNGVDALIANL